jgi:hypothetical protein
MLSLLVSVCSLCRSVFNTTHGRYRLSVTTGLLRCCCCASCNGHTALQQNTGVTDNPVEQLTQVTRFSLALHNTVRWQRAS